MVDGPAEQSLNERRHVRRLVSSSRAHGGVGAVSAGCHAAVPEVDGVVLSVFAIGAEQIMISDSGSLGDQLEDLHTRLTQGPVYDAAVTGDTVIVDDLRMASARVRWPAFAAEASAVGIHAVFVFPILVEGLPVAVLSLYRAAAGPLSTIGQAWARRYSEAAAIMLQAETSDDEGPVLPVYAGEIQQAVGIVMELAGVDAMTALHRLRAYARSSARPMPEVVAEVRTCRLPFDPTVPA